MAETEADYEARFWQALDGHRTGMLGLRDLRDGHSQPMTAHFEGNGPLWFFTHADTQLAEATASAEPATFHYASRDHELHACIHGTLVVDRNQAAIDRFWSAEVERWLPEGPADPRVTLLRFVPDAGQVWVTDTGPTLFGFRFGGSAPADKRAKVDF